MTTVQTDATQSTRFADLPVAAGLHLHVAQQGHPDGHPMLLLHGWSDSWFSFSRILPLIPENFRVIVPDQRGHGDSARPAGGYSIDELATDVVTLLEGLRLRSATVVGHSLGSFIAQRVAMMYPHRVDRLVLIGTAASARNDVVAALRSPVAALTDPVDIDFVREFQMSCVHRTIPAPFLNRVINESLKLPAFVWKAVLSGMLQADFVPDLMKIQCPTLLVWGERDSIFGFAEQQQLLEHIPTAKLKAFAEVGHSPHWEIPEEFVRHLIDFCTETERTNEPV